MSQNPLDLVEEQIHFSNVVTAFQQYSQYTLGANNRRRKDLYTIPRIDQELLESLGYKQKLNDVDDAIQANARFLNEIVDSPEIFANMDLDLSEDQVEDEQDPMHDTAETHTHAQRLEHSQSHSQSSHSHTHSRGQSSSHRHLFTDPPPNAMAARKRYRPTDFDMDKLRSTLKQFVRDWSVEGQEERDACYTPMTDALLNYFSDVPVSERKRLRVLVPGAGLGRLAFDVASLGFACQGNEFSHYMLLSSFLILNRTRQVHQHTIYPFVHSFSNIPSRTAILKSVTIPDILPSEHLPSNSEFSLVAGDFEEIYGAEGINERGKEPQSGQWDAVLTCFFIDTAKNIVNYLRIIHRILTPGGIWINLGPLLWHWENNTTSDPSIELDLEEVKELARKIGFTITNERTIDTTYTTNAETMLGYVYHAAFWTATKMPQDDEPVK